MSSYICYIEGKVLSSDKNKTSLVNQGVGYSINYTNKENKEHLKLLIHHEYSESSNQLWGFEITEELLLFERLIKIDSIGTKKGYSISEAYTWGELTRILLDKEINKLTEIKGIGVKVANHIIDAVHKDKKFMSFLNDLI